MQNAVHAHKQSDFLLHLSSRFISYSTRRTCYIRILNKQTNNKKTIARNKFMIIFVFFGLWFGLFLFSFCAFSNTDHAIISHTTWCNEHTKWWIKFWPTQQWPISRLDFFFGTIFALCNSGFLEIIESIWILLFPSPGRRLDFVRELFLLKQENLWKIKSDQRALYKNGNVRMLLWPIWWTLIRRILELED